MLFGIGQSMTGWPFLFAAMQTGACPKGAFLPRSGFQEVRVVTS
jgi:hypothetical protein